MTFLQQVRSENSSIFLMLSRLKSNSHDLRRDEKSNLIIEYKDGRVTQLPIIPFRTYQLELQRELFITGKKRFLIERPRRSGKEIESWNLLIQAAIEKPGLYLMIYPTNVRAKMVLWDGSILTQGGNSLRFLNMIPSEFILSINNQEMSIKLTNDSVIRVLGSDIDPDKLRGTNPLGIVLSEFAFSDPGVYYILLPILRQNGGWLIAQSTYNGMNHFKRLMLEMKSNPDWYCREDSIDTLLDEQGNPYITAAMVDEDRRSGMPEYLIQQEYYGAVEINQETMYFANEINNLYETDRIIHGLILPDKPVYAFYDIGMKDQTAVILAQLDRNYEPHIIHYFENNNKTEAFYVAECRRFCTTHNLILHSHYVPHDGKNRPWASKDTQPQNAITVGRALGELFYSVDKPANKQAAIQSMRRLLYRTKFNKENTARLIDCLSNYSKEFDDERGLYKDAPYHDWSSHGVSAYQTLTLALEKDLINTNFHEIIYYAS